jgi:phosphoglycolate phosphatase
MAKAVIFDFDGTLTELTLDFVDLRKEVEEIAQRHARGVPLEQLSHLYIIEMIYEVERLLGKSGAGFRDEAFAKLRELEVAAAAGKDVYPYTRDVLRVLRKKGVKVGVMTRSCIAALKVVFPGIEDYVDAVVTREDVRLVKPDPYHVEAVLAVLDVRAEDALLVGDHPTDVQAGETLEARTVGVLTGRTTREQFEAEGADYIVNDIRDVLDLVGIGT